MFYRLRSPTTLDGHAVGRPILRRKATKHHGPCFLSNNFDPDYNYLLNSLSLLKWRTPGHTDHQGTTLQLLGAVVVWFQWLGAWLLGHRQSLTESVLSHPAEDLRGIQHCLNALICATLYWATWAVYRLSNSLCGRAGASGKRAGVRAGLSRAAACVSRTAPTRRRPRLMTTLAPMALRPDGTGADENLLAGAAGAMFGFGLITRVTFAPWVAVLFPKRS